MSPTAIRNLSFVAVAFGLSFGFALPTVCSGGAIKVEFTGVDIQLMAAPSPREGMEIVDMGLPPDGAHPLTSVAITEDGELAGPVITEGISHDLLIPKVSPISAAGGPASSAAGGSLDLALGSGHSLSLELGEVDINYVDLFSTMQFVFAATVGGVDNQNLPYGLEIGQKLGVSFSTQVEPGSLGTSGGFVTSFIAAGTGEVEGPAVPEPTSFVLLMLVTAGACSLRHRRK